MDNCRVLEIGCAEGGNLIPLAESFPESEFVGIDVSEGQCATAADRVSDLRTSNVTIRHLDLRSISAELGRFDYIIAHGIFSWVPQDVQNDLLRVSRRALTQRGLAYVSYNTYPGWSIDGVLRSILIETVPADAPPRDRIRTARSVLEQVASDADAISPFGSLLARRARDLLQHDDHYIAHDHLEVVNLPVWFLDFAQRAEHNGLQYVDDLVVRSNVHPSDLRGLQYIDRISGNGFRASVLCDAHSRPVDITAEEAVPHLYVAGNPQLDDPAGGSGLPARTLPRDPAGRDASPSLAEAVVREIARAWPASVAVEELIANALQGVTAPDVGDARGHLLGALLKMHRSGTIELGTDPYPLVNAVSQRPVASPSNRWAAGTGTMTTGGRHDRHHLDRFAGFVTSLLDGERTQEDIVRAVVRAAELGDLSFSTADDAPLTGDELLAAARETVPQVLAYLATAGLLVR